MNLQFQWDTQKAASNERKHRVTFAEAVTEFRDPLSFIFDDEEHSERSIERSSLAIRFETGFSS